MKIGRVQIDWRVLVGAGGLLLVAMFLPWFGTAPEESPFIPPARKVTINAWESFDVIDLVLAVTALAAVTVPVMARRGGSDPGERELAPVFALSALSALLIVYRLFDPIENTVIWYGAVLGLVAVIAIGLASLPGARELRELSESALERARRAASP